MLNIIILNNMHIIKKIKNKEKLTNDDLDLIETNLSGYNNALRLIMYLHTDKYCVNLISQFIDKQGND